MAELGPHVLWAIDRPTLLGSLHRLWLAAAVFVQRGLRFVFKTAKQLHRASTTFDAPMTVASA